MVTRNLSAPQQPFGLAYLIGRLDHVLNTRLRDSLAPAGLTVPQYTALWIFRTQGSLSNAQLALRTMTAPQSANELLRAMEAKGWVARNADQSHGRIIQISLTEEGQAILLECDHKVRELEEVIFADLQADQRAELHAQLRAAVGAVSLEGI